MNNANDEKREKNPSFFEQENAQELYPDQNQDPIQYDEQSGHNQRNGGDNNRRNQTENTHREDRPFKENPDSQGTYEDNDLNLSEDDEQMGGYNRPNGGGNNSGNRNDNTRREDNPSTDKRNPLGSYQDTDQYGNGPSKDDLDDNYDREGTDGDRRSQSNYSDADGSFGGG